MADNIITVPTYEQIATILNKLALNYSYMASVFEQVFYDPTPAYVDIKIYDENGELVTYTIPNRAKDLENLLSGEGSPENYVEGGLGTLYQDLKNGDLYIKETPEGNEGWNQFATKNFLRNIFIQGNGDPNGVVTAPKGILYIDVNFASLYIKTSPSGNTGWELITATIGQFADVDLSNLSTIGESKIANPDLSNLTLEGEDHFLHKNLSNINEAGRTYLYNNFESLSNKVTIIGSGSTDTEYPSAKAVYNSLGNKQNLLVSGTNIKTVEGFSLLGSGNVRVFPDQMGKNGKVLTTDGVSVKWDSVIPTGTTIHYAGNTVPEGYLMCAGQTVSRSQFPLLYDVIGTSYGNGDGTEGSFNLPDLIDKFIEGSSTAGTELEAGLPNIKGTFPTIQDSELSYTYNNYGRAFFIRSYEGASSNMDNHVSGAAHEDIAGFNANRCSNVYRDDVSTVQPSALTMIPIIKY